MNFQTANIINKKTMANLKVKITGSGTKEEIIESLESTIIMLMSATSDSITAEWEDATLMTEIYEE